MRYWAIVIIICAVTIMSYAALVYTSMETLTVDNAYLCQYIRKKINIAQSLPQPKLIILAGSNAYAGISAEILTQELQLPTFNFGLHAAFSPHFLFYLAQQVLTVGDVVLLPLEYSYYHSDSYNDLSVAVIFGCGKKYVFHAPWREQIAILFIQPLQRLVTSWLTNKTADFLANEHPTFGAYGDATYNQEANITQAMRQSVEQQIVGVEFQPHSDGIKAISEFLQWCQRHQIQVLATWPNIPARPVYADAYVQNNLAKIREFYVSHHIPVIGEPKNAMFDLSYFYDTAYHLHRRGVRERTYRLLPLLKSALIQIGIIHSKATD
jgi:hypothetical protein